MKAITSTAVSLAFLALASVPTHAAEMKDVSGTQMNAGKASQGQAYKGQGTVNRVDANAGKVNLTHGPIASLNWPGMTMDFAVADKQALAKLKPSQKVEFKVAEKSKGQYVITEINPAK